MKWTPEQKAEIARQKAASPNSRRVFFTATPQQEAELLEKAEAIQSARPELTAHYRKVVAASKEPGFSGWLRRRIRETRRPIKQVAGDAQIDLDDLIAFRTGEATLSSDAIDRLIAALGLTLVEEAAR